MDLIDRIRTDIQERLDALLSEADKLRKALQALDPRGGSSSASSRRSPASTSNARRSASSTRRSTSSARRSRSRRTPPGATKRRVLEALSDGNAKTAGEVSAATGITRGTASTTLSKLAKSGEVVKAERGYRLPAAG